MELKKQYFGLELEFTGIDREKAANAIAEVLTSNTCPAYYEGGTYRAWDIRDLQGRKWMVERDSSIQPIPMSSDNRCEFVTPKLSYSDIPTLQECIRALRRAGAKVNSSCGLHIHVDASNHTAASLRNLAYTMKAKQSLIFKAVGTQQRRLERWCRPIDDKLIDNLKAKTNGKTTKEQLADVWYNTYRDGDRSRHYHESRYHALNFHSVWYRGTVEFRLFEATLHAGEVRAYINLVLAMSAEAINKKRASSEENNSENDAYTMRCWLLRLGFIGEEYKNIRLHLMKNLEGNAAWRNGDNTTRQTA